MSRDVTKLLLVAEAADDDRRPWEWEGGYPQTVTRIGDVVLVANTFEDPDSPSRFAEFIATFDPPTVRWLLHVAAAASETARLYPYEGRLVRSALALPERAEPLGHTYIRRSIEGA